MRIVLLLLYSILQLAMIQASGPQPPPPLHSCKQGTPLADNPCLAGQNGCSITYTLAGSVVSPDHKCEAAAPAQFTCTADLAAASVTCQCKDNNCNHLDTIKTDATNSKILEDELEKIGLSFDAARTNVGLAIVCLDGGKREYTEAPPAAVTSLDTPTPLPEKLCKYGEVCQAKVKSTSRSKVEAVFSCADDEATKITAPTCNHDATAKEIVCKCNTANCNDEKGSIKAALDAKLANIEVKRDATQNLVNMMRTCKVTPAAPGLVASQQCQPADLGCKVEITLEEDATTKIVKPKEVYSCSSTSKAFDCSFAADKITCECNTDDCNDLLKIDGVPGNKKKLVDLLNTKFKGVQLGLKGSTITSVIKCKQNSKSYTSDKSTPIYINKPSDVFCEVDQDCLVKVHESPERAADNTQTPPYLGKPASLELISGCVAKQGTQVLKGVECKKITVSSEYMVCSCSSDLCNDETDDHSMMKTKLRNALYEIKLSMAANGTLYKDPAAAAAKLQCKVGGPGSAEVVPCIEGQCTYTASIDGETIKEGFDCVDGPTVAGYECTSDAAGKKVVCACSRDGLCNRAGYVKLAREFKEEAFKVGILVNDTYFLSVAPTTTPPPTTTTTVEVFYEDNAEDLMEDENSAALISIGCALLLTALFV